VASNDKKLEDLTRNLSSKSGYIDFIEASQRLLSSNTMKFANAARFLYPLGYDRHISMDSNASDTLMSDFFSYGSSVSEFIDFGGHPILASARTPNIRLYKLIREGNRKKTVSAEIEMPLFLYGNRNSETVLNPQDRSNEAYFLGLNFDMRDQTAFGASRHVYATLSLGFNSFNALSRIYQAPGRGSEDSSSMHNFAYVDLIRRTNGASIDASAYADYSIRMEIGWNPVTPNVTELAPELQGANESGAEYNNLVLLLELEDWELDIQQDGKIKLDISYHAFVERELSNNYQYDVLNSPDMLDIGADTGSPADPTYRNLIEELKKQNQDRVFNAYKTGAYDINKPAGRLAMSLTSGQKTRFKLNDMQYDNAVTTAASELKAEYIAESSAGGQELVNNLEQKIRTLEQNLQSIDTKISAAGNTKEVESLENEKAEIQEQLSEENKKLGSIKGKVEGNTKASEEAKKGLTELLDRIDMYNKVEKYQGFLRKLSKNGKIYSIDIPKKELLLYSPQFTEDFDEAFSKDDADFLKKKKESLAAKSLANQSGVDRTESFLENLQSLDKDISKTFSDLEYAATKAAGLTYPSELSDSSEDVKKRYQKAVAIGLNKNLNRAQTLSTSTQRIHYVYFGDIIETIVGPIMFAIMQSRNLGLLMGSFIYDKKMNMITNQEVAATGTKSVMGAINFSDVPISIEMFSRFFSETIINKNVSKISFLDFMNGMVNQLIIPSLNEEFAGISNYNPVKVKTTFLRTSNPILLSPATEEASVDQKGKAENKLASGRYDLTNPDNIKKIRKLTDPNFIKQAKASQIWHYLFVYGIQENNIAGITATYEGDMKKGIYHFTYGDSSGSGTGGRTDLIKDIKFIKVKKSGQREMMVERHLKGGRSGGFLEIFNIFDIEMTMIGNNLLHPGKHIYIRPVIAGFSRLTEERSIIQQLGLGGYYMVTEVSNEIGSTGEWVTSVKAAWQSNGGGNIIRPGGKTISQSEADKLSGQYYDEGAQMTTMTGEEEYQTSTEEN